MASNGKPVTKAELTSALRVQSDDFSAALRNQNEEFSAALRNQNEEFSSALRAVSHEFGVALRAQNEELKDFIRQIETNLLTEFHRYAKGQQARMHSLETGQSDVILRLATIEDRLLALESRRPPSI